MVAVRKEAIQSPDHYKQMWMHERNRRIEVEQENIRLRKIVYNTKFSPMERMVAIEIADQVKEAKHTDTQGRKLVNQTLAADKLEVDRSTIHTAMKVLEQSGFIADKDTSSLKDAEGKKVRGKDGNPIYTTHLSLDQNLLEDFSLAERATPRKIKENRKKPVYTCRECGTDDITIKETTTIICKNPNCKKCGHEVFVEASYTEQKPTNEQEPDTEEETSEENLYSAENFNTIELLDNSAENFNTIEAEDESNKPNTDVSASPDHDSIIKEWLNKRRGSDHIIYATGSLDPRGKYKYADKGYQPDIDAFIAGDKNHMYGSRLLNPETGLTNVLCFEIDRADQDEQAENYLLDLARAGAAPVYWQRYANDRRRGHIEIYIEGVDPEVARQWVLEICPDLEEIPECYPCKVPTDKQKQGLSWPLYQRIGDKVYHCNAIYMLPSPHEGGLQECDPTNKEQLTRLITRAVTPASLIEEFAIVLDERENLQSCEQERENVGVCFIGISPKPYTQVQSDRDLKSQVIAEQCARYSWDDIAAMCGGYDKGFFKAVWRGERTASVRPDKNSVYACDYGNHGMFPKKMDTYGAYCLIHDIDQKADIAERCAELRRAEIKIVESVEPAAELFPTEQQQPVYYTPCIVCSKPKSVLRIDGVYICGTQH